MQDGLSYELSCAGINITAADKGTFFLLSTLVVIYQSPLRGLAQRFCNSSYCSYLCTWLRWKCPIIRVYVRINYMRFIIRRQVHLRLWNIHICLFKFLIYFIFITSSFFIYLFFLTMILQVGTFMPHDYETLPW